MLILILSSILKIGLIKQRTPKRILIMGICILFSCTPMVIGQTNTDSLNLALKSQKADTNKVKSYEQAYILLRYENHRLALEYIQKSLELAKKLNYTLGELSGYLALGEYYENRGKRDSAHITYSNAYKVATKMKHRIGITESMVGLSSTLASMQNLKEADSIA
ncbi:MAG: hypothetical protein HRU26_07990, partial [Psychroserpens sp.]|nr:hypothetical protein [Psychroserpens sp.]